jgi:hypothetical protein
VTKLLSNAGRPLCTMFSCIKADITVRDLTQQDRLRTHGYFTLVLRTFGHKSPLALAGEGMQ